MTTTIMCMFRRFGFAACGLLVGSALLAAPARPPQADASDAEAILQESGVRGGLIVVVGCGESGLLADIAARPGYVVHAIDARAERVASATQAIRAKGLYGKATTALWDGGPLPYVDNSVNLLIVSDAECAPTEMARVLAPRGVAVADGKVALRKDVPPQIDDWSHHLYDASGVATSRDTRVGQPRSMQWKGGPEYSRSHENMASVSAVVSAGGRVFAIMDEGPAASIYLPARWVLTARDAFSGVLLWKVPIEEWHDTLFPLKSGPQQLPRRLVATPDRVYATLGLDAPVTELDAATGEILRSFDSTAHAEEVLCTGGMLFVVVNETSASSPFRGKTPKSRPDFAIAGKTLNLKGKRGVVALDVATGTERWRTPAGDVISLTLTAAEGKVTFVKGNSLVCLDMASGEEQWSAEVARKPLTSRTTQAPVLVIHGDMVYTALSRQLTARTLTTGEKVWSAPCAAGGYRVPMSLFVLDGLIWDVDTGGEPYRPGSDLKKINRFYVAYDLRTGEEKKRLPVSGAHGYAIMHHRCHVPRAAGNSIITSFPGIEFFDVTNGTVTHDSWIRGACLYGFMPANGLVYTPPHPCACYTQAKLTGFWAVAPARTGERGANGAAQRLTRGPAHGTLPSTGHVPPATHHSDDWPTYRGGAARSGVTRAPVSAEATQAWIADVGPGLSQCVAADEKLFVASDDHMVHALDALTGAPLWSYSAGGRVDSPPTYHRGVVVFGSRDGYVYCLSAAEGTLVWRFRAGPHDRRCVAYDQVESVWPVHGSVLVHDGIAWFCAGRSSYLDGGLTVYRLNAGTGELLSTTTIDSLAENDEQKPITPTMFARLDMEGAKNDVLSCDGSHVFMRHWALDLTGKSVPQDIDHLFSPTGFLDDSWFRRTYWIFGRMYVSGAQGWARAGNVRPTGRIMSVTDDRIYGFGRDMYPPSPGNNHQMYLVGEKELLFAVDRAVADSAAISPVRGKKGRGAKGKTFLWATPGDLQVRGLLLAGTGAEQRLIVTGAKGDWITSQDAYEGNQGSVLRFISVADGKTLAESLLPGMPVFDGLSASRGRLYMSLVDGRVLCLASRK